MKRKELAVRLRIIANYIARRSSEDRDVVRLAADTLDLEERLSTLSHEEREAILQLEREVRTAFDAGFTLGVGFGCAFNSKEEAEAAKRLERVPTAATCQKSWDQWNPGRAERNRASSEVLRKLLEPPGV